MSSNKLTQYAEEAKILLGDQHSDVPEKDLLIAIIGRAIADTHYTTPFYSYYWHKRAIMWFESKSLQESSFLWTCHELDLSDHCIDRILNLVGLET